MKKSFIRKLSLVLSILVLAASLPVGFVSAEVAQTGAQVVDYYYGTDFTYKTSYNGKDYDLYITDYTGSATDLVIPTTIWDHRVKGISEYAFASCKNLVSVTIPEGTVSIGSGAFQYCTALKSIIIPSTVTSIGTSAFRNCTSLTSVYVSDLASWCNIDIRSNYDSSPLYYAKNLYVNNSLVTSVSVPYGVTTIPSRAFSCENITSVTLPSSVTKIDKNAFASCKNLKSVSIPSSVTEIDSEAFYACDNLKNITIPASVQSIGDRAFTNCNSLEAINVNSANQNYTSENGVLYNKDMTVLITYPMDKYDTSFTVPEGVETIYSNAFYNNRKLQNIVISEGVTTIQGNAFEHTFSLVNITIPKSLTHVYTDAFKDCLELQNVYITDVVAWCGINYSNGTANPLARAKDLYINNELVGDLVIPEGVESIAVYAFAGTTVSSVTFPESLKKLGEYCFHNCNNLRNVVLTESITTIPSFAFGYCKLEGLTIPKSVTRVENNAFYSGKIDYVSYCGTKEEWEAISIGSSNDALKNSVRYETKLIGTEDGLKYRISTNNEVEILEYTGESTEVVIPATIGGYPVKVIKAEAFYENEIIESLVICEGIEIIEEKAFADCTNLASVSLPQSVRTIGRGAFWNATRLTHISLPANVESIGPSVFSGTGYYNDKSNWTDGVLYIDDVLIKAEKAVEGTYEIKTGTRVIADEAFMLTWTEGIVIPPSVEFIGTDAFYNESLDAVYITDIVAWCNIKNSNATGHPLYWADELYVNDELISELVVPDEVTLIPAYAFSCVSITSLVIPESVKEIENNAFYGCKYIKRLTTAYSGDFLCRDKLGGCPLLESVVITEGVTSIGENAFSGCSKLTHIEIPDTVGIIGEDAFAGCRALTSIDIPDSVTVIEGGTFSNCSGLTSIDIPDGVESIGNNAFSNCTGLTSIDIPDKVTNIDYCTFINCSGLTSVVIPEGVKAIGTSAFEGCTGLVWVLIPESVEEIGWNAFEECTSLWHVLYSGTETQWKTINISYYENVEFMETPCHYSSAATDIVDISKKADCVQGGYEGICCELCKEESHSVTTEALGHNFDNGVCTVCGGYLESKHPYQDSMYERWTIHYENAESISITFSEDTHLDWEDDYIYIFDADGNELGCYCGNELTDKTVTVNGDTLIIQMSTNSYRVDYGFRIVDITVEEKQPPVYKDEDTSISIEVTEGDVDADAELVAEEITDDSRIEEIELVLDGKVVGKLYDITLQKNGEEIELNGKVQVRIPAENENSEVFRLEEDGSVTDMNAAYEDGFLVFETEHFSLYVVAVGAAYELGDVNLDSVVNVKDATTVQKWVASIITLSEEALAVADVNADGAINVKDATTIQKKIAGLI